MWQSPSCRILPGSASIRPCASNPQRIQARSGRLFRGRCPRPTHHTYSSVICAYVFEQAVELRLGSSRRTARVLPWAFPALVSSIRHPSGCRILPKCERSWVGDVPTGSVVFPHTWIVRLWSGNRGRRMPTTVMTIIMMTMFRTASTAMTCNEGLSMLAKKFQGIAYQEIIKDIECV